MKTHNLLTGLCLFAVLASTATAGEEKDVCEKTAKLQKKSAAFERKEELRAGIAVCINLTDPEEFAECVEEARVAFAESKELAQEQYEARLDLCEKLGGGAYDPEIDEKAFPDPTIIDNPYLPFPVGAMWLYTSETDEGTETITVEVLGETREILGIECVSVRDTVTLGGECVEDTIDWFAQDALGNVWYFGEISFSFEDGYVADIEGSWLSGEDGAKPGIVMLANPTKGMTYRQEWLLGDAEDAATVLLEDTEVEFGEGGMMMSFEHCVKTADFLPPEPDELEHKYYAPGIGFVYETKEGEEETVELVSYSGLDV